MGLLFALSPLALAAGAVAAPPCNPIAGWEQALADEQVRWIVVGVAAVIAALAIGLFVLLPKELAPQEDQGVIVAFGQGPEGATIDYTDKYARMM